MRQLNADELTSIRQGLCNAGARIQAFMRSVKAGWRADGLGVIRHALAQLRKQRREDGDRTSELDGLEIEKKFIVDSDAEFFPLMNLIGTQPSRLAIRRVIINQTITTYWDNDNFDLRRRGLSLRTRVNGVPIDDYPRPQISLKTQGFITDEGITVRDEHEEWIDDEVIDFSAFKSPFVQNLLSEYTEDEMKKIFVTSVKRNAFQLNVPVNGKLAVVEICFDNCRYLKYEDDGLSLKHVGRVFEIEIELKQEDCDPGLIRDEGIRAVEMVSDVLYDKGVAITINTRSKAQIGFDFCGLTVPEPAPAPPQGWQMRHPGYGKHNAGTDPRPPVPV